MHYEKENSLIRLQFLCGYLLLVQVKGKSPPKKSKERHLAFMQIVFRKKEKKAVHKLGDRVFGHFVTQVLITLSFSYAHGTSHVSEEQSAHF